MRLIFCFSQSEILTIKEKERKKKEEILTILIDACKLQLYKSKTNFFIQIQIFLNDFPTRTFDNDDSVTVYAYLYLNLNFPHVEGTQ